MTVAPTSAVPLKIGVASLVTLSVLDVPVSEAVVKSGMLGAAGAVVSIVTASPVDATLTLPARSVCFAVSVWAPLARIELVIVQLPDPSAVAVPSTVVPLVSYKATVAPASDVPVRVGVVILVRLSVVDDPLSDATIRSGALGAATMVSMVTTNPAEATLALPAVSDCFAVRVCAPSASAVLTIDQFPETSAVAVPNTVVPLVSYRVTVAPATAPLPVKVGVVVLVTLSVVDAPLSDAVARSGALTAAGATVSTVTANPADATLALPAGSVCFAVTVCAPSARVELVIDQFPDPSAVAVPNTVVPLVS